MEGEGCAGVCAMLARGVICFVEADEAAYAKSFLVLFFSRKECGAVRGERCSESLMMLIA